MKYLPVFYEKNNPYYKRYMDKMYIMSMIKKSYVQLLLFKNVSGQSYQLQINSLK